MGFKNQQWGCLIHLPSGTQTWLAGKCPYKGWIFHHATFDYSRGNHAQFHLLDSFLGYLDQQMGVISY